MTGWMVPVPHDDDDDDEHDRPLPCLLLLLPTQECYGGAACRSLPLPAGMLRRWQRTCVPGGESRCLPGMTTLDDVNGYVWLDDAVIVFSVVFP